VKDPSEVVKVSQRVMVTVIDIDLARNRIALSMRAKPELGAKTGGSSGGAGKPQQGRAASPKPPPPPVSLAGDWFTAALNRKK